MRLCTECTESAEAWSHHTAPPGRCSECGRAFDLQGVPLQDESVTCPIHEPILASCPHTSAEPDEAPAPIASWLVEDPVTIEVGTTRISTHEPRDA